jgi:hypothetical protein
LVAFPQRLVAFPQRLVAFSQRLLVAFRQRLVPDDTLKLLDSVKSKIKSEEQQVRSNLLALNAKDLAQGKIKYDNTIYGI